MRRPAGGRPRAAVVARRPGASARPSSSGTEGGAVSGPPAIRLHHCPGTRSARTLWLLHELGVTFDLAVRPFDRTLRDPGYLALSPAGRVPSLEIDGAAITETGAIAEILCERFSPEGLGRPPGHPERADWLVWVHFAETVSQHAAALTQQHVVLREDAMRSPTVMKIEALRLEKCYAAIEAALGDGREHLLASGFTAADVGVGQAVDMARRFARLAPFERLAAWHARVTARPAWRASLGEGPSLYDRAFYEPWPEGRGPG